MTIAEQKLKWMYDRNENAVKVDDYVDESEIRESEECIGVIWPGGGEHSNGHWLDVFTDGSALQCIGSSTYALSPSETKQMAGRWKDYKAIKHLIK
ncbi:MAG TPA: hypothetical protein VEK33_02390 [Terriglobales bacterium]|nr:hypothetical protein [Terriglobales bacterium]